MAKEEMSPAAVSATPLPMASVVPSNMEVSREERVEKKAERTAPLVGVPLRTLAPPMPPKILATLHEDWHLLDPEAPRMLDWVKSVKVFHEFAHARDPFHVHLRGTWQMLECWNQPQDICRCGLLHSGYARSGFNFRLFDIHDPASRPKVAAVLGDAAEQLIYQYCSTWDDVAWAPATAQGEPLDPSGFDVPSRLKPGETVHISAKAMAKLLVCLVADVADQATERFSYRDIYHHEEPELNWPGNGQPALLWSAFSKWLKSSRPYLDVVPPVFNGCTELLSEWAEVKARNLYWKTMQTEHKMTVDEREAAYRRVCELNPFVAEPHVMLSQELYRKGCFAEAVHEAAHALEIFYQWGTCWDKRHPFAQWVGFARMMVLRAKRREQGLLSLPSTKVLECGAGAEDLGFDPETRVTFLQDVVKGFEETTECVPSVRNRARL
uniref:DUF6817 domain-containing protein n=1 Tax=Alexandrium monilatum TaxID=311494 RepID=A0A6T0V389_9DINO